jgi:predicted alpha/beta superfamily hydrolase
MIDAKSVIVIVAAIASLFHQSTWAQGRTGPVVIGETVQLHSKILNESRSLLISKPAGYDSSSDRYPVLYLLDGETHFQYTSAMVNFLADDDRMPETLVVGIDGEDTKHRTHDLTPPSSDETDNRFSPGNGGAEAFLSFIADELVPFIERSYRTRPYRLLVGHSFGGLFGIYCLGKKPHLFNGYIAADPTLDWNKQAVANEAESFLSTTNHLQADFYLTVTGDAAGTEPGIVAALRKKSPFGFRWHYEQMKDEDHMSIPLPSIYRGLEVIFEDWNLTRPITLYDQGGLETIHNRFREAGNRFGYPERDVPAFTISILVAELIKAGRLDEASKVLLHDPVSYPPPWNQLDAIARNYEKRGDTLNAIRYYRMSLEQNPQNEFARKKLLEKGIAVPATRP